MPGVFPDNDLVNAFRRFIPQSVRTARDAFASQKNGVVVSIDKKILNFLGDGVSVTDEPASRRTNIIIPGGSVATAATAVVSAVGDKCYELRSPASEPTNWFLPAFVDSGWANAIADSHGAPFTPYSGAAWVTASTSGDFDTDDRMLTRKTFTLPAGSVATATLQIGADNWVESVYINGVFVNGDTITPTGTPSWTWTLPTGSLVTGTNVLAVRVKNRGPVFVGNYIRWIFRLVVNVGSSGVDARYQLLSEKDQPNGYVGLDGTSLATASELGSGSPSGSNFLRGDRVWAAASTNAITVQEVDGSPTVAATQINFPNGSLGVVGSVATYTPPGVATVGYIQLQHVLSSGTNGGTNTATTWTTRPINTVTSDVQSLTTLSSNQFTLPAGTYEIRSRSMFFITQQTRTRLRNITDSTTPLLGLSGYYGSTSGIMAFLSGIFTISGTKTFALQYWTQFSQTNTGLGTPTSSGDSEIYAEIEIHKVA